MIIGTNQRAYDVEPIEQQNEPDQDQDSEPVTTEDPAPEEEMQPA